MAKAKMQRARRKTKRANRATPASRKRATDIRSQVLKAIGAGKNSREQLKKTIGCSMASVDAHLKALRDTGEIQSDGRRPATFYLEGSLESPRGNSALTDALVAVVKKIQAKERLRRTKNIGQKIETLEVLAAALPPAVSKVLREILADYRALQ